MRRMCRGHCRWRRRRPYRGAQLQLWGDGGVGPEQGAEGLDPSGLGAGTGGDDSCGVTFEVQVQWRWWRDDRAAALLR
jgi:hypothetical protein